MLPQLAQRFSAGREFELAARDFQDRLEVVVEKDCAQRPPPDVIGLISTKNPMVEERRRPGDRAGRRNAVGLQTSSLASLQEKRCRAAG